MGKLSQRRRILLFARSPGFISLEGFDGGCILRLGQDVKIRIACG